MLDGRVVEHVGDAGDLLDELRHLDHRPRLRHLMLRLALAHRPPTGFLRDFVVEDSGEHRGQLDIKQGGLLPIIDIARYASFASGARALSTPDRLRVASTAGTLDGKAAQTLAEAFDLFWRLRLEHQVEQLRHGVEPDDYLDPETLNPLTRRYLRDAFHAVRTVQRRSPSCTGCRDPASRSGAASAAASAYRRAKPPPPFTPWREARFAVVDLEMTGLDPSRDEIISFAAVPVEGGKVVAGETSTAIVRPERMPSAETIRIHGLRPADLADAPPLDAVRDRILEAPHRPDRRRPSSPDRAGFLSVALRPAGVASRGADDLHGDPRRPGARRQRRPTRRGDPAVRRRGGARAPDGGAAHRRRRRPDDGPAVHRARVAARWRRASDRRLVGAPLRVRSMTRTMRRQTALIRSRSWRLWMSPRPGIENSSSTRERSLPSGRTPTSTRTARSRSRAHRWAPRRPAVRAQRPAPTPSPRRASRQISAASSGPAASVRVCERSATTSA